MKSFLFVFFALVLAATAEWHAQTVNPGLKVRITQKGLKYAAQQAINVLSGNLRGKTIPDQSGGDKVPVIGSISYSLYGMKINSFTPPVTSVSTSPFKWFIRNAGASIHGNWRYRKNHWPHISDHGSFDISLSSWSIETTLVWGVDGNGRPTLRSTGCVCGAGDISVKFHGGASWLYNLFKKNVAKAVRSQLQKQLCSSVDQAINVNGAKQLASLKVSVLLDKKVELDYRLVRQPAFTSTYMETYHKGEIFWVSDRQEAPFSAPPLPDVQSTKMVTFWLSQYVMNTLGYIEYKHGALAYRLTNKELPEGDKSFLNTTCSSGLCIGNFILQLKKLFPNSVVALTMSVSEAPKVAINSSSVLSGTFTGGITYSVILPNKQEKFAFSTQLSVTFAFTVDLVNLNVTANITNFNIGDQKIVKSDIGEVPLVGVNYVVKGVVARQIQPLLQGLASRGIMLPNVSDVKYINPKLALVKNALVIATDAQYTG